MECFRQLQIFLDRCDFIVQSTTFLFEFEESVLVGVNSLFKADQNIGEFFQKQTP